MRTGLLAEKLGMTRVFGGEGGHIPVTVLRVDSCEVVAARAPGQGRLPRASSSASAKPRARG